MVAWDTGYFYVVGTKMANLFGIQKHVQLESIRLQSVPKKAHSTLHKNAARPKAVEGDTF